MSLGGEFLTQSGEYIKIPSSLSILNCSEVVIR